MASADHISALKQVSLFQGLSDRELKSIARDAREEPYSAGQNIVTEGSRAAAFFLITSGRANVVTGGKTIRKLGPGSHFGEMALFDASPRAATVTAETQVQTLVLSPQSFAAVLAENWAVTKKILAELSARIRTLDKELL
jgi:CRP/FNR family transcriptional regulator, cyclic AMP receptor protein